jgi:hypothetical protein
VSSPFLSHTPHRRRTGGSRGATQRGLRLDLGGVSQSTLWRQGWTLARFIFIFYFVKLPLCNKYSDDIVTFISIHCYYMCCLLWRIYEMHPALSLKFGCDNGAPCEEAATTAARKARRRTTPERRKEKPPKGNSPLGGYYRRNDPGP